MPIRGGSGGATKFTDLTDVPAAYSSQALLIPRVNAAETALEFSYSPGGSKHDCIIKQRASDLYMDYFDNHWKHKQNSSITTLIDAARAVIGERITIGIGRSSPANPMLLDDELVVGSSGFLLEGLGSDVSILKLANGVNKDMIDITGARYVNVKIRNLKLDGNHDNNPTGGHGINGLIDPNPPPESMGWWLELENLTIKENKGQSMNLGVTSAPTGTSPQCRIHNIRSYNNEGTPEFTFKNMYDSQYSQLWASSMKWDGCTKSTISQAYVGGGGSMLYLHGSQMQVNTIVVDQVPNGIQGIQLVGDDNQLKTTISNKLNTTAIEALRVTGDGNSVELLLSDDAKTAGAKWDVGVREGAGSERNYYKILNPHDLVTAYDAELITGGGSYAEVIAARAKKVSWV